MNGTGEDITQAATEIERGGLVIYPTETVYGLGADALNPEAIERVFDVKDRARDKPLSFAFPDVESAVEYVHVNDNEHEFLTEFLPGPVTVVCEKHTTVPDELTGGRDRVGVRVPDHEMALALLERVAPITATSANVSGHPSVTNLRALDDAQLANMDAVLDAGETPGTESTVVDVERGDVLRRGANADAIEEWLHTVE